MKLGIIKTFTFLSVLYSITFGQEPLSVPKSAMTEIQTVGYCELMEKPDFYIGKTIRLEAIFSNLISNEGTLSFACKPKRSAISVSFADEKLYTMSDEIFSKLNFCRVSNANVTAVGKFFGPRSLNSKFNYGHYGWSKYLFEIDTLEKIECVPEKK